MVNNLAEETEKFLESLTAWKNAALPQSNIKDDQNMNAYVSPGPNVAKFHYARLNLIDATLLQMYTTTASTSVTRERH